MTALAIYLERTTEKQDIVIGTPILNRGNFAEKQITSLKIEGRHDSAIVERAMVVCENAVAIALCDLMMLDKHSRI